MRGHEVFRVEAKLGGLATLSGCITRSFLQPCIPCMHARRPAGTTRWRRAACCAAARRWWKWWARSKRPSQVRALHCTALHWAWAFLAGACSLQGLRSCAPIQAPK